MQWRLVGLRPVEWISTPPYAGFHRKVVAELFKEK